MEKEVGKICAEGFSFFGMTNRLISHEIKNILAIISETSGLMNELVELSEKGMELPPDKLRSLSESMIEEVQRANRIVRNMNTFAHSVDDFFTEVDMRETMSLMTEVCPLDSALRKTELNFVSSDACFIFTSPLFLENLIFHVINFSLRHPDQGKKIRISLESKGNKTRVTLSGLASKIEEEFPTSRDTLLAEALSAEITLDAKKGKLYIDFPERTEKSPIQNLLPID
jgi:light-regulated signal transduction histidine kinase (bacteriophytochrome)